MRPKVLTTFSVLSLLLCLASISMWVRSHRVADTVGYYAAHWEGNVQHWWVIGFQHDTGGLLLFHLRRSENFERDWWIDEDVRRRRTIAEINHLPEPPFGYPYMGDQYAGRALLGFGYYSGPSREPINDRVVNDDRFVLIPYWLLVIVTLLPPALWFSMWIRRRRREFYMRHCRTCGYDLRATPERCPECGRSRDDRPKPIATAGAG